MMPSLSPHTTSLTHTQPPEYISPNPIPLLFLPLSRQKEVIKFIESRLDL